MIYLATLLILIVAVLETYLLYYGANKLSLLREKEKEAKENDNV